MRSHLPLAPVLLLLASALVTPARADDATRQRVEGAIRFLADDLLEGRGTPGRGLDVAAVYLANELRAAGWKPGNRESYLLPYELRSYRPSDARIRVKLAGQALDPESYLIAPFGIDPAAGPLRAELVFVGHGVVSAEKGVDDLAGADLRGKAALTLLGAPWKLDPQVPFGQDRAVGKSIEATVRGARLLVYVTDELPRRPGMPAPSSEIELAEEFSRDEAAFLPELEGDLTMGLGPILFVSKEAFDRALATAAGGTYDALQKKLARKPAKPRTLAAEVEVAIETEVQSGNASDVVAILEGADPALRDEWVVLSAHYDHLGTHPVKPGEDGIFNGADDNASGTATVLEIARRLAADGPPKRSVLVLLTSGEERGLLGSAHYAKAPLVPPEKVVVDVSVDMVGRSTGSVQGIAPGCAGLFAEVVETGKRHAIEVLPDQAPTWRLLYLSDHYHFARFDVPSIFFFTGLHPDYHQPTDEADKIRFDELGRILDVTSDLAKAYAMGAPKPGCERPAWFLTPR